jgi:hypothetical protein
MAKYFPDWTEWDEQVPLYDFRGWDPKTIESVGPLIFTRAMPRADLIALKPGELLIAEFDRTMILTNISRLERYIDAVKNDYVRPDWKTRKVQATYITPGFDARFEDECKRKGYRYIVEPEPL